MGNTYVRKMNTGFALRQETTEGTLIAEQAGSACLLRSDGFEPPTLSRELLDEGYITASLSATAPVVGMFDDLGFMLPVFARGKGTLTYPDWHEAMTALFGSKTSETTDAVAGTPKTTIFDVATGANFTEGQLILVNVTGVGYCITRVTDVTTNTLTVWPPLPATPTAGDAIYLGISWLLSSSSWPTFSAYFHFDGPKQAQLAGCRSSALKMGFTVGQRANLDFTVKALSATLNNTARGVTPTTDTTTKPPTCMGMTLDVTYSATAKSTPTTTSTVLNAPNFGVATTGDYLLADVGTLGSTVTITFTHGTDIINKVAHGLSNGARVKLSNSGGALPAGLSSSIVYYVVNKNDDDFQISLTSGGTAVLFTDDGTGTHYYQVWTKNTGNYQTVAISNVSGDPGNDTTLTHAALTCALDSGDTCYVQRKRCAGLGDTVEINIEYEQEMINCMQATYGRLGSTFTKRTVTVTKNPWFDSWQEFKLLENVVSAELRIILGSTLTNIFAVYMPNVVNREASLTGDDLMKIDATAQAVTDTRFLGNDDEIVVGVF